VESFDYVASILISTVRFHILVKGNISFFSEIGECFHDHFSRLPRKWQTAFHSLDHHSPQKCPSFFWHFFTMQMGNEVPEQFGKQL